MKKKQGFASMDKNKRQEIAARGGYSAHRKGVAHTWTPDEARIAGRKGGLMRKGRKFVKGGGN